MCSRNAKYEPTAVSCFCVLWSRPSLANLSIARRSCSWLCRANAAPEMALVAFTGWAIMVFWEIAALPFTLPLVRALKRHEGVDYFDIGTNFNSLHF